MLNKCFFIGNLTRDPQTRYTQKGEAVCSFTLAINRKYKAQEKMKEETTFIDIVAWGKLAENCSKFLSKGKKVLVEGRLTQSTFITKVGETKTKHEIIALNTVFLSPKENSSQPLPQDDLPF